jgi:hypothetical protein
VVDTPLSRVVLLTGIAASVAATLLYVRVGLARSRAARPATR